MRHLLVALLGALAIGDSSAGPAASTPPRLTESQQILAKVMDDIRRCDKSVRYQYDSRTKQLLPRELGKIKGLKLQKLHREIAVFDINETYEGLRALVMTVGRPNTGHSFPSHSVAFRETFQTARDRLQVLWQVQLEDGLLPGPDVVYNARYAAVTMSVEGKRRTLSIERTPLDVYPHIARPEVGCNQFEN